MQIFIAEEHDKKRDPENKSSYLYIYAWTFPWSTYLCIMHLPTFPVIVPYTFYAHALTDTNYVTYEDPSSPNLELNQVQTSSISLGTV